MKNPNPLAGKPLCTCGPDSHSTNPNCPTHGFKAEMLHANGSAQEVSDYFKSLFEKVPSSYGDTGAKVVGRAPYKPLVEEAKKAVAQPAEPAVSDERLNAHLRRIVGELRLKEAVAALTEALNEDKGEGSLFHAWQANIAMAFKDAFPFRMQHLDGSRLSLVNEEDVHHIANKAAKLFLQQLSAAR